MLYNDDIPEIQLKVNSLSFIDLPECLEEVNIEDFIVDLQEGSKNIHNLHLYHCMRILCVTLQDIILLQKDRKLFNEFRKQQLAKYEIEIDIKEMEGEVDFKDDDPSSESDTSRSTSPILFENAGEDEDTSLMEDIIRKRRLLNPKTIDESESKEETKSSEPYYIPIESLVKDTKLDVVEFPITVHCIPRIQEEYNFAKEFKLSNQTAHLLKSFNLLQAPSLSIEEFLTRIKTYSPSISILSYVHAAYIMFKLCIILDMVPLTNLNVYRFIIGLIRCLTKCLEDVYQKQTPFATVGGVSTKILYKIELGFLYLCNFKLLVGEDILNNFLRTHLVELRDFCKKNINSEDNDSI